MFKNRTAILATMHRKEQVISPLLEQEAGLIIKIAEDFDTDQFGTFSRENPRTGTQLEAARQKALSAISFSGYRVGIASEGSFGLHPSMPFLMANIELVILMDRENDLEIVGQAVSAETNFAQKQVYTIQDAVAFAMNRGFPEHAVLIMFQLPEGKRIIKGLSSHYELKTAMKSALAESIDRQATIESDMRAYCNPTRMKVIKQATVDLLNKMKSKCPACHTPGYAMIDSVKGLPCGWCGFPTDRPLALLYRCLKCAFEESKPILGQDKADPGQCLICNP